MHSNPHVGRLVILQLATSTMVGLLFAAWQGFVAGYSAFLGGMVITTANTWFLWRLFGGNQASTVRSSEVTLAIYYRAEIGKMLLVATLLVLILVFAKYQAKNLNVSTGFVLAAKELYIGFFTVMIVALWSTTVAISQALDSKPK